MPSPEPGPMTPEQWDEVSTRGALIAQLRGQRGAGRMIMAELRECREANARLRAKLAAWDAWEHAWVFGGDAEYPGSPGVTDPRETLDTLERLALGVEIEPLPRLPLKGYHDVEEFYPPNEEADDA